jgi:phosphoglycerate dehydrogenase-like enzyme
MKAAFFNNGAAWMRGGHVIDVVYGRGRRKQLAQITDLYPEMITSANFDEHVANLQDLDVIFSTWGMVPLTEAQIKQLPNLKAVFYAAGATPFRGPFEAQGIKICSATALQAVSVAEFALAQVLLAGTGYWRNSWECVNREGTLVVNNYRGHGNYENRVAIIGNGAISQKLQEFLGHHDLEVIVVPSRKEKRTVSLEEVFRTSFAVVNLLPDRDDNVGVLNGDLFSSMIDSAVFINVGRGRQVNEDDLIRVMKARPDLTALLDVQWPEPPVDGSELYTLPNVKLSGHIAGATGSELVRLSAGMIEEFLRFEKDEPLLYEVQPGQL